MLVQTVVVSRLGGLVDQRGSVAQKYCAFALLHRFIADTKPKVSLSRPGGGHDQLVLMALSKAPAKGVMGSGLEGAWWGKGSSIITPRRC
jgi:hypothetical protein